MKIKKAIIAVFILFTLTFAQINFAQNQTDIRKYFPETSLMNGFKLSGSVQEYKGRKLFDLINGAGEIFFEFGFDTVFTGRYTKGEEGITIQFYVMNNVKAAHGIYCYHRNPDDTIESFDGLEELNVQPNGVNFYLGKYFIKVESFDEGEQVIAFIKKLTKNIISKIKANEDASSLTSPSIPLPTNGLNKKSVKLLSGNSTAGSGDDFYQSNPFKFSKEKSAYFGKYTIKINAKTAKTGITAIKKSDFTKGRLLYLMGKKLHGSKESALQKSFYVDGLPILGYTKNNMRYFVLEGTEYIYIFSMVKSENLKTILSYIGKNKSSFK